MVSVSDRDLLAMWNGAQKFAPPSRASAWIADAGRISVARRDAEVLALREACFGPRVTGLASCPGCGARVELALTVADLAGSGLPAEESGAFTCDGYEVAFRLPAGDDLAAIAGCGDVAEGRQALIERCVLQARHGETEVSAASLPPAVIAMLSARAEALGSAGDAEIAIVCPDCGTGWSVLFDAPSFFWSELQAGVRRLFDDVHLLASAYGWSEESILGLPRANRAEYVERVVG